MNLSQTRKAVKRREKRARKDVKRAGGNRPPVKSFVMQDSGNSVQKPRRQRQRKERRVRIGQTAQSTSLVSTDIRLAASVNTALSLANQVKTITIDKALTPDSLFWLCAGYLSQALSKGFLASASADTIPYLALTYMVNVLAKYVQALDMPITELPYWFLCLCHAVSPKSVPFEGGMVSYKFELDATLPIVSSASDAIIGYVGYSNKWTMGGPTGSLLNNFPICDVSAPSYDEVSGAGAFQELSQFMENSAGTPEQQRLSKRVASTIRTPFMDDVSVFSLFTNAEGVGSSGFGGGIYGLLQLEVPIRHPILAVFSSANDTEAPALATRNFNWTTPVAGDPTMLGALMSTLLATPHLSMKRNVRAKPIDFLEFGDVMAQWVVGIVTAWCNVNAGKFTQAEAQAIFRCKLTLQEMLILLRNVVMGAFKDTVASSQGLSPFTPTAGTDNEFVSYVSGSATAPIFTPDMSLPAPLVENIRALAARQVKHKASAHDLQWYVPCLGQYQKDALTPSDYQVTYIGSDSTDTVNVFNTIAFYEKTEVDSKGVKRKQLFTETPISLVDGKSGTSILFINDPKQLKILTAMWNDWIKDGGLDTYSIKLVTLGTEKGINLLASLAMTRVWISQQGSVQAFARHERRRRIPRVQTETPTVDLRMVSSRYKALTSTPYATRNALVDLSQGEVLSVPYEQFLQTWILPIDDDEFLINDQSTIVQRWQFIMGEPYSVPRISAIDGTSLASLHAVYASKMVKGQFAEKSDWAEQLTALENSGRGGLITGLVASLLGKAIPALGGIAGTIADALPI